MSTKRNTKPLNQKEDFKTTKTSTDNKLFNLQNINIDLKCKNETQKELIKLINSNDIVVCSGSAGTGKTFIACAQSLKLLKTEKYKRIMLVKSVTELEGESVGYIKGSLDEKMYNYTLSFLDNFHKLIGEENTKKMVDMKMIEVLPLAYIRGRSIDDSIIIVDEVQNLVKKNIITTLTRIGNNSKIIFCGDSDQVDLPKGKISGLGWFVKVAESIPEFGVLNFTEKDIVRNPIIKLFLDKVKEFDNEQPNDKKNQ
jgi:phosphate starvation-inducible PhoH-like protein